MKSDLKLQAPKPYFERIRNLQGVRVPKNIFLVLLLFWVYIFCTIYLEQIIYFVISIAAQLCGYNIADNIDLELSVELFLTLVSIALTFVCCKFIDNRPFRTMYLTRGKVLRHYLTGALLGFAMMSAVILMAWCGGAIQFEGMQPLRHPFMMLLMFAGWLIQGFSEELSFRGWLMTSAGTHHSVWLAVAANSICFALVHASNDGFAVFPAVNLVLFGLTASLLVLRTGNLWGAAALHSIWNWAQGNFFGKQVSGIPSGSTVLRFTQTQKPEWLGGGEFGLEGGAATTVVLLAAVAILLLMPQRTEQDTEDMTNGTV